MISEAIILAGGLGTRLREAVPELPKCMAPVGGKPFLHYVVDYFKSQGIKKIIFALGHQSEAFTDFIFSVKGIETALSVEPEPLGTGGAIQLACSLVKEEHVIITNGDTLFKVNLESLSSFHLSQEADCTLCLKPMQNFSRYGVVEIDQPGRIQSFQEKKFYTKGLINGGIYALKKSSLLKLQLVSNFSFEKDYLEACYNQQKFFGLVQDSFFIDIGIPDDYRRAQEELK